MKILITALSVLILHISITTSQATQQWLQTYDGPGHGYDEATSIWVDAAGNSYVTGESTGSGTRLDMTVIKYNIDGVMQWSQRYNGTGNLDDHGYLCKSDAQGNVYVSGSSTGIASGLDYLIIKYNSQGIQQWVYRYNGPGNSTDEIYSFQVSASGNVYLTGYSHGVGTGDDVCTIKLNPNGDTLWVRRYNGSENNDDFGNAIQIDAQGNCYVTGAATTSTDLDFLTIKYDANGNQVWAVLFDGPAHGVDFPSSNAIDAAGNIYDVGYISTTASGRDYCTIKYNNNGVQQWVSTYNGPGNALDEAFSIVLDGQNNVYITGNSNGGSTGDDYCTIKYNNNGAQQWVARYDGTGRDDYPDWLAVDATGNVYVTGLSLASNNIDDIVTIGYNTNGVQQWVVRYNGTGNAYDSGNSLAVDTHGGVYVAGGSDNALNTDFITIKYNSPIGIQPISTEIPKTFSLSQNYPNPFNPSTRIKFDIPPDGNAYMRSVQLKIYDILGHEVNTVVNESLKPGSYEVTFDGSNLASGMYFYKISAGSFVETKKMMMVK